MTRTTIAEQCKQALYPYEAAAERAISKSLPTPKRLVYHFEDGSFLAFAVTYTAAETGVTAR